MADLVTYAQRLNALRPTRTWTVRPDGLNWKDVKDGEIIGTGTVPLGTIRTVRLRFEPSRAERKRVALHIDGVGRQTITNIDYRGILDFHHQPDAFRQFVAAVHAIFPDDSPVEFHAGSTWPAYIFNMILTVLILGFLLLIAPILSVTGIPAATTIGRILIILFLAPTLLRVLVKNRPRQYSPDSWPEQMLT